MSKEQHYKKAYGNWAGDEAGHKPNFALCCEAVWTNERWSREHQCQRKCGHGPDGAFCKQHDPAAKAARRDAKQSEAHKAKMLKWRYEFYGKSFHDALVKIAEGHNDARGLARELIDKFNEGSK